MRQSLHPTDPFPVMPDPIGHLMPARPGIRNLNRSLGRVRPIMSFTPLQQQGVNDTTPCQKAFWAGVMLFKFRKETRWTRSSPHTLH